MKGKNGKPQNEGWRKRAQKIRLLLLDVDGVLTDGRLVFDGAGAEIKSFHIRDGQGIKLLQRGGVRVGILSGRGSKAVEVRCRELGMELVFTRVENKLLALEAILEQEKLSADQVAYLGDDLVDVPVLSRVGLAVAVADAVPQVKGASHYISSLRGGEGAVREVCENILKAQGKWDKVLQSLGIGR